MTDPTTLRRKTDSVPSPSSDLYGYRQQFHLQRHGVNPYPKRHLESSEEGEEEEEDEEHNDGYDYREDGADSEDSDENHKEIDYPDENTSHDGDHTNGSDAPALMMSEDEEITGEEDSGRNSHHNHDHTYHYHNHHHHHHNDNMIVSHPSVIYSANANSHPCCICAEIYPVFPHRLDELDHHPTELPTPSQVLMNPCQKHYICVSCIKSSLLNNAMVLFKDGQGNFPCLGDGQCQNDLQQRTTTFIYQLRDLFTDGEWNTLTHVLNMHRSSQSVSEHHPFIVPLCPSAQISPEMAYNHLQHLMTQDHPRVQCPICLVPIQKTTACFAIRHCDWEMCWMCGKVDRRLDTQHWKGCPRYDSNPFWNLHDYQCSEGRCFNDDRVCTVTQHALGRSSMDDIRKAYQVMRFYESFSPTFQSQLNTLMQTRKVWPAFVQHQSQYHAAVFTPR